jgi:hypothetical protein
VKAEPVFGGESVRNDLLERLGRATRTFLHFVVQEHVVQVLEKQSPQENGIANLALTGTPLTFDKAAATWFKSPCQPITSAVSTIRSDASVTCA